MCVFTRRHVHAVRGRGRQELFFHSECVAVLLQGVMGRNKVKMLLLRESRCVGVYITTV